MVMKKDLLVNFRTHRQSYKSKKKIENPQSEWKIFENTHDAIVDEETFYRVQELRKNKPVPPEPERAICSPVWFTVLTAVKNCTTAPAKTSRSDRITSFAPLPADGDRKPVHPILSGLLFWKKVLCGICSW